MTNWPEKKEVPERIDTSGWSNIGDIEDANSDRYCNMSYNEAQEECSKAALEMLEGLRYKSGFEINMAHTQCALEFNDKINALIDEIRGKI